MGHLLNKAALAENLEQNDVSNLVLTVDLGVIGRKRTHGTR
jgi:hypothetical protein